MKATGRLNETHNNTTDDLTPLSPDGTRCFKSRRDGNEELYTMTRTNRAVISPT